MATTDVFVGKLSELHGATSFAGAQTKRAVAAAAKPIENGRERCGTGRFDALDDALLTTIMMNVSFVHRLACTTSVCKAWRALRHNHPLWTELVVTGDDATFAGYHLEDFDKGARCGNKGLERLMSWLPSLSNVTNVSIHTGNLFLCPRKCIQTFGCLITFACCFVCRQQHLS